MISLSPLGLRSTEVLMNTVGEFAQYLLWLNILRSKKNPKEVCNIFINYLTVAKGVSPKYALIVGRRTFLEQSLKDTPEIITRMILLETRAFNSGSLDWWIHFLKRLVYNRIYSNIGITNRVLQTCIFSCDSKTTRGCQR